MNSNKDNNLYDVTLREIKSIDKEIENLELQIKYIRDKLTTLGRNKSLLCKERRYRILSRLLPFIGDVS